MNQINKLIEFNTLLLKNNVEKNQKVRIIEEKYTKGLINLSEAANLILKGDK